MPVVLSGTNGVTFPDSSLQAAAASPYVLKNRIINGDMVISQRNGTSSVTPTNGAYTLDRWTFQVSQASKLTSQQNAGSVTPPVGFKNYLGITSSSAYSVISSDYFAVTQRIEGYNMADLAWGTANAKTVTLSFWVRSSLTGTFGGSLWNNAGDRSYPFTYTISSANTWEQKSITIVGDTTGTWNTTNETGISVNFSVGSGSSLSGTAGAWASALYTSATGAVSVVGTSGATFYITGVQLEQNTTATPFERRLYNQELANCYRYYQQTTAGLRCFVIQSGNGVRQLSLLFPTPMRASPTVAGTFTEDNGGSISTSSFSNQSTTGVICSATSSGGSIGSVLINSGVTISAEL
jgi:hypothetical protein